ncbi:MAG: PilZ domain-containing protein [Thermodesulfobacteriota bacterium]
MTEKNDSSNEISNINLSEVTSRLMKLILQLPPDEKVILLNDLENKTSSSRRKNDRIPYLAEIDFAMRGKAVRGYISNISESGMFVESYDKPDQGTEISMAFPPPSREESVKLKGKVVRVDDKGFAVEFENRLNETLKKYDTKIISDIFIK